MMPLISNLVSKRRGLYHSLSMYSGLYVYPNDNENTEYNRICSEKMDICAINCFKKLALMLTGGLTCAISTVWASFYVGNRTTTTAVKFPYIDEDTEANFIWNSCLQWTIYAHAGLFYAGIEIPLTLFENFAQVSPELIHLEFKETIEMYETQEFSESQRYMAFRNIVLLTLDFEKLVFNFSPICQS